MAGIPQPEGAAAPSLRAVQAHQAAVRTAARMRQEKGRTDRILPMPSRVCRPSPGAPRAASYGRQMACCHGFGCQQHELALMVRAGDCLRPAGRPVSLPAGSPPAPVGCHSAHGAAAVPAAAHVAGRSGSATVNYVLAGTLGWSRVWDGTGPGLWWCDSASMPVVPGSLCSGRGSRSLLAAWVRVVSPIRT